MQRGGSIAMNACGGILVVDDDLAIRETLQEILAEEGYSVVTAENGSAALTRMREARPCVVLLDLTMPVMDGFEFRRLQLEDPALAAVPVVVLSADGNPSAAAAPMNPDRVLKKPVHLDEVLDVAAEFCRSKGARSAVRPTSRHADAAAGAGC